MAIEKDCIVQTKKLSEDFFDKVFKDEADKLLNFAYGLLKDYQEAEDAVQDIFIKFWRNQGMIKHEGAYRSYLYKIARNHLLNCLRDRARKYNRLQLPQDIRSDISTESPVICKELNELAETAISGFPPRRKQVYQLKKDLGLTNQQIAQRMGISVIMVQKHWRLALRSIKEHIKSNRELIPVIVIGFLLSVLTRFM